MSTPETAAFRLQPPTIDIDSLTQPPSQLGLDEETRPMPVATWGSPEHSPGDTLHDYDDPVDVDPAREVQRVRLAKAAGELSLVAYSNAFIMALEMPPDVGDLMKGKKAKLFADVPFLGVLSNRLRDSRDGPIKVHNPVLRGLNRSYEGIKGLPYVQLYRGWGLRVIEPGGVAIPRRLGVTLELTPQPDGKYDARFKKW